MKGIFVILMLLGSYCVKAQSKVINLDSLKTAQKPKTESDLTKDAKPTDYDVIYKCNHYKGYTSKNGKLFIVVQAATSGNWYRKYIKQD